MTELQYTEVRRPSPPGATRTWAEVTLRTPDGSHAGVYATVRVASAPTWDALLDVFTDDSYKDPIAAALRSPHDGEAGWLSDGFGGGHATSIDQVHIAPTVSIEDALAAIEHRATYVDESMFVITPVSGWHPREFPPPQVTEDGAAQVFNEETVEAFRAGVVAVLTAFGYEQWGTTGLYLRFLDEDR